MTPTVSHRDLILSWFYQSVGDRVAPTEFALVSLLVSSLGS